MKKNKLYTVSRFNKPAFIQNSNVFLDGGLENWKRLASNNGFTLGDYMNSTNIFGLSKVDNPFSKGNIAGGIGAMANTGIGKAVLGVAGGIANQLAYNGISGGLSSGAGKAIGTLGNTIGGAVSQFNPLLGAGIQTISGAVGGGINALVGTNVDQAKKAANDAGTAALNNYVSAASNLDAVNALPTIAAIQDAHRGGVFKKGWADEENAADREARANALAWAERSRNQNINNILADQLNEQLAYLSANGGPLVKNANKYPIGGYIDYAANNAIHGVGEQYYVPGALEAVNNVLSYTPVIGTIMDLGEFAKNPTWENFGWAMASLGSDVLGASLLKGSKAATKEFKAAKQAEKEAEEALDTYRKTARGTIDRAEDARLVKQLDDARWNTALKTPFWDKAVEYPIFGAWLAEDAGLNYMQQKSKANNYDDGGALKASLLDDFGSDPIGAVMRYNQGLERMAAANEAKEAEAAREAAFTDMQNRIAGLETQNQGLQAMMPTVPTTPVSAVNEVDATLPTVAPTNGSLRDFIKAHEGFRSNAYWLAGEPAPTIGYGFHINYPGTNRKVQMGDKITREEADKYLDAAIEGISKDLSSRVPNWDKLTSYQKDALIDLAYGTGTGGAHFKSNSKLMTALKNEDWEEASKQLISRSKSLPKYDKYLLEISKHRQNMFRNGEYNMKAFGGELGTNGTDWTSGLLHVNAGGSHEDNVLGGVPMGVDEQGIPNLVEEGETVFNDYVFSNRLVVPEDMYKDLGLGGRITKGITFAEASKELAKESEQRPNDPISKEGLEAALAKLAEVQEAERMVDEMQNTAEGNTFAQGGEKGNMFVGTGNRPNVLPIRGVSGEFIGDWNAELANMPSYVSPLDFLNPNTWLRSYQDEVAIDNLMRTRGMSYRDAAALVDLNRENTQTGIAPIGGRAGGYRTTPVRQNTRAFQQSRQVARGQMRTPQGGGTQRVLTENTTPIEQARQATTGSPEGLPAGWSMSKRSTPTVTTERIARTGTTGKGQFAGRETSTTRLNPKSPTGSAATSRGSAAEYDKVYEDLAGTVGVSNPYLSRLWPWAVGATGVGAGLGIFLGNDALRQANLERMNTNLGITPNAATVETQPTVGQGTVLAPTYEDVPEVTTPTQSTPSTQTTTPTSTLGRVARTALNAARAYTPTADSTPTTIVSGGTSNTSNTLPLTPLESTRVFSSPSLAPINVNATRDVLQTRAANEYSTDGSESNTYPTWMRYAPAVGAGLFTLTDALGLTNKPDYTYADRIEAAANRAGVAPNISYNPIGNYLTYTPMDIWAEQNRMDASSRATDRNIMNTSGGNRGTALAGQIANSYASQLASGQLFRNALDYRDVRREKVEDFNRRTNMFNRQMGLEAAMANARYSQQASQLGLSGLVQAAALRDSIDQRIGAARAANINNLLTSLGNIGRENFAMNQLNSDKGFVHWVDKDGVTHYKRVQPA